MRKLTILVIALLILGGIYYGFTKLGQPEVSSVVIEEPVGGVLGTGTTTPIGLPTLTLRSTAWQVFVEYREALKAHNLEKVASLSYQLSDSCKDKGQTKECFALMDSAYSFATSFQEVALTHIYYDSKQLILASDYYKNTSETSNSITRGVIYFVREDSGVIKFLTFSPFDGAFIVKTDKDEDVVEKRLEELVQDTDRDGLSDSVETCSYEAVPSDCKTSNPKMRDTDENGWWDGIQVHFR